MKKIIPLLLVAILIVIPVKAAHAQISFLLGVGAGALLFGDRGDGVYETRPTTVYILPRASERVKNPLAIQFAQYDFWSSSDNSKSLYSMFKSVEPNAGRYEILEVVRVIKSVNQTQAVFWFAYIAKEHVLPLEALSNKK